jgi:hypothetical protein
MPARSEILYPNDTSPKGAKYERAWALLLGFLPDVTQEERAHAKVWLTYRAIDGEILLADWKAKIAPVSCPLGDLTTDEQSRWLVSQRYAEILLRLFNGEIWHESALHLCGQAYYSTWPATILHYLRLQVLLAYREWLNGFPDETRARIRDAWATWKTAMQDLDYTQHPFRASEASGDLKALQALNFIGQAAGLVAEQHADWMTTVKLVGDRQCPWSTALKHLSAQAPDPSRVIFPASVRLPGLVTFTAHLTAPQRALWDRVKAAGVTHVPCADTDNLGDYIQTWAAQRWCGLGKACTVPRDNPALWPEAATVLLCGWYGGPFLPPSLGPQLRVIVCGFHLHPAHVADFEAAGLFHRLKAHVIAQGFPAGCRDLHTVRLLQRYGIDAEFSGCPTQTLPNLKGWPRKGKMAIDCTPPEGETGWEMATHRVPQLSGLSTEGRLDVAEQWASRLASREVVMTTRLHAALPALASGVPEVRVIVDTNTPNPERWDGFLP